MYVIIKHEKCLKKKFLKEVFESPKKRYSLQLETQRNCCVIVVYL